MYDELMHYWQPHSEVWHGDWEWDPDESDYEPEYGVTIDQRFDRHPAWEGKLARA